MLELEVIFRKEEMPSGLSTSEILGGAEEGEILMISEYNDGVRGSEQEMVPVGDSAYDCEEFSIIDLIISFGWSKRFGEVEAWVVVTVIIFLKENPSSSDKGGVSCNGELLLRVRVAKNGGSAEGFFNFVEGIFLRL